MFFIIIWVSLNSLLGVLYLVWINIFFFVKKNNVAKYYNLLILSIEGKEDILNCKFNLLKSYLNRMLRKSY